MEDLNDPYMRNPNGAVQARAKAQNRANVLQLKLMGQGHPTGLTTNLLKLFEPRPPLEYKPPLEKRKCPPMTGMAHFVDKFAEPGDAEYAPPVQLGETPTQKKARIHKLKLEKGAEKAAEDLKKYDPNNDPDVTSDPYKTLFVARLAYDTSESRIKREFESYGPIKRVGNLSTPKRGLVRLIADKASNKPRGYAFIEYLHTRDMKAAYKQADGRKIDGRRVLVDVERGRTVPNWRPRRLGGGLGTSRVGGEDLNQRNSGRELSQSAPPRSEEPRAREDRHGDRDRERSRDRGRDKEKEREKSRERSHDRPRDRNHREDKLHRDRDRNRDRDRDRERDHGRDRDRERGRGRDRDRGRDHDRDRGRDRERHRDRERDYDVQDVDLNRGHSWDRESEYDHVSSKHERSRNVEREQDHDHTEHEDDQGRYEQPEYGRSRSDADHDHHDHYEQRRGQYNHMDVQGDDQYAGRDQDRYDQMEEENYQYDNDYRNSKRSLSREYDH